MLSCDVRNGTLYIRGYYCNAELSWLKYLEESTLRSLLILEISELVQFLSLFIFLLLAFSHILCWEGEYSYQIWYQSRNGE